jgi:hypothetical protein
MMGCLAFCRGRQMLGCYVNRALSKKKPPWMNRPGEPPLAWVRLGEADLARALKRPGIGPARTGARTWVEIALDSRGNLAEAVRWFGRTYEHAPRASAKRGARRR